MALSKMNPRARGRLRLLSFLHASCSLMVLTCGLQVTMAAQMLCHKWAVPSDTFAVERACRELEPCAGPSYRIPQAFYYSVPCSEGMDALCEPLPDGLSSCWDWQWATDPIRIPCPDLCTPGRRLARVLSATAAKLFASFLPQHALKLHIDQAPASDAALTAHYELRRLQEALPPPPTTTQFLSFPNLIQLPDTAGIWVIPTIVIIWTIVAAIMIWLALKKRGDPMSVIVFPDYLLPDYMLPELMTAGPVEVQGTGPSLASGPSTVHRVESLPQSSLSLARGSSMQVINNPLARFSGFIDNNSFLMRPHDPEVTAVGTIHVPNTRRPSVLRANINARASITKGDGAMGGFMFAGEIQPQGSVKDDPVSAMLSEIEHKEDGGSPQVPLALLQRIQATQRAQSPTQPDTDTTEPPPPARAISPRPQEAGPSGQDRPQSSSGRMSRAGSMLGGLWRSLSRGVGRESNAGTNEHGHTNNDTEGTASAYRPRAGTDPLATGKGSGRFALDAGGVAGAAGASGAREKRTYSGSQAPEKKTVERPLWTKLRPSNAARVLMTAEERAELDALEAQEAEEQRQQFETVNAALAYVPPRNIAVQPTARMSVLKRPQWSVSDVVDDAPVSPMLPLVPLPASPGPIPLPFLQALVETSPQPSPRSPTLPMHANPVVNGGVITTPRRSEGSDEDRRSKSPPVARLAPVVTLPETQRARSSPGGDAAAAQRVRPGSSGASPRLVRVGGGHAVPVPGNTPALPTSPKGIAKIPQGFRAPVPPPLPLPELVAATSGAARVGGRAGGGVRFAAALGADSSSGGGAASAALAGDDGLVPARSPSPALSGTAARVVAKAPSQRQLGRSNTALSLLADKYMSETGSPRASSNGGVRGSQSGSVRQSQSGSRGAVMTQRSQGRLQTQRTSPLGDVTESSGLPGAAEE